MKYCITFSVIIFFLITGCVSSYQMIIPNFEDIKSPETNTVVVTSIGERLLESGRITSVDGFTLPADVKVFDAVILAGEYHQIGIKDQHKVFGPKGSYGTGMVGALSGMPSPARPFINGDTGYLCFIGSFGSSFCSDEIRPSITKFNIYTADSFIQELIYTGKVGNKIRFTYREFQNGIARQAFTVDVEYDLSEGNQISYKGATIEILSATNQKIKYKVLKHFK